MKQQTILIVRKLNCPPSLLKVATSRKLEKKMEKQFLTLFNWKKKMNGMTKKKRVMWYRKYHINKGIKTKR